MSSCTRSHLHVRQISFVLTSFRPSGRSVSADVRSLMSSLGVQWDGQNELNADTNCNSSVLRLDVYMSTLRCRDRTCLAECYYLTSAVLETVCRLFTDLAQPHCWPHAQHLVSNSNLQGKTQTFRSAGQKHSQTCGATSQSPNLQSSHVSNPLPPPPPQPSLHPQLHCTSNCLYDA